MTDKNIKKIAKEKGLEVALSNLKKTFGKGFDRKGSDLDKVNTIRTGHDDLDSVLVKDGFGIAKGRIIELSGPESSGKSSVALRICGYAQKEGMTPVWLDLERSLMKDGLAEINGVDMNNIIIPELVDTDVVEVEDDSGSPFNAGKVLDMMAAVIKTGKFNPVVLDSVAGLVPEREMNAESFNKEQMMEVPRLMSKALKKISQWAAEKDVCVIFINQERDKPNPMGPTIINTPGGRALKFFSSQRLRITKRGGTDGDIKKIDEEGKQELIGHWAKIKILKNRCAPPYRDTIEIPIYYKQHFPDDIERLYEAARILHIITMRKNVFTWKSEEETVFSVDGACVVLSKLREDKKLLGRLAYECVIAEKSDKNQKKKTPYRIPPTLISLADSYSPKPEI